MDKAIGPIRPVLVSYWLNIHVTSMLTSYGTFAVAWGMAVLYFAKYLHARGLPRFAIALPLTVAISGTGILFYRAFAHQMPVITDYALALVGTPMLAVGLAWAWLALDGGAASKINFEDDLYLKSVEKHFYRICQVGFVIITTGIILGACGPTSRGAATGAGIRRRRGRSSRGSCTAGHPRPARRDLPRADGRNLGDRRAHVPTS